MRDGAADLDAGGTDVDGTAAAVDASDAADDVTGLPVDPGVAAPDEAALAAVEDAGRNAGRAVGAAAGRAAAEVVRLSAWVMPKATTAHPATARQAEIEPIARPGVM